MHRARPFLVLTLLLGLSAVLQAEGTPEPVLEIDLGGGKPTETFTPLPTPTPVPPTPTAEPTLAPTAGAAPVTTTAAAVAPATDLNEVRFDKGQGSAPDDGLMIIAPGAASPEDSLESFGIDSPFNWKHKDRENLQPGKDAGEDLELAAPESSDLRERVSVENGEGETLPTDQDYDQVERVGAVLSASEYRMDGRLVRTKDGQTFAREGIQVALRMEPGRQVYPGSVYTVFRECGVVKGGGDDAPEIGMLVRNVGVLKVTRIEGDEVLARVEKQYEEIRENDLVRLRDPERLKYYNLLRQGPATAALDLRGFVGAVAPGQMITRRGGVVYLDIGRAKGVVPGMRLMIYRQAEDLGADGIRPLLGTGRMGFVEVINTSHDAAVARVVQCTGEIRIGDQVRYR